jgi:hypothetical protein
MLHAVAFSKPDVPKFGGISLVTAKNLSNVAISFSGPVMALADTGWCLSLSSASAMVLAPWYAHHHGEVNQDIGSSHRFARIVHYWFLALGP